ncbi:hepatitis A virus cellular receptor 1 isoform X1 [Oryctolagus cuniculus]|uniref:hepatitis A virus cellular receptor 1 isoform X1 n=1 Tax=Oryctolagus cuniculus TaxID=9986 RepID=UPI003879F7A4
MGGYVHIGQCAVVSYTQVSGVVGWPVTLPCTYSVTNGAVTSMCWGRGACPTSRCSEQLIWTDGSRVTFQKDMRYKLKGDILQGNVSLTIENGNEADSGLYCCRIEHWGWFNDRKITLSLEVKPAPAEDTSVPTSPRISTSAYPTPAPTQNHKPAEDTSVPTSPRVSTSAYPTPAPTQNHKPAEDTSVPTSPRVSTSAYPTPAPTQNHKPVTTSSSSTQQTEIQSTTLQGTRTQPTSSPSLYSCPTDGNGTMTQSSDGLWHNNQTQAFPAQNPWMTTTKGIYIGIFASALVLLAVFVVMLIKIWFHLIPLKLELHKLQIKCESEQKTISTLLRIIFMLWNKTWRSSPMWHGDYRRHLPDVTMLDTR